MFKRLVILSIISVNIGYTLFLFSLLSKIYPDRVPFTMYNLIAYLFIDTIGGIILALTVHIINYIGKLGIFRSAALSMLLLWSMYWLFAVGSAGGFIDPLTMILDGVAAFISWAVLATLATRLIKERCLH